MFMCESRCLPLRQRSGRATGGGCEIVGPHGALLVRNSASHDAPAIFVPLCRTPFLDTLEQFEEDAAELQVASHALRSTCWQSGN